jgi:cytoskeletal protein CcmA (bactofilin family)
MWGDSRQRRRKSVRIQTLVGQHTEIEGDIHFSGGLHVDGVIRGNVIAEPDTNSMLTLSEHGSIIGEVHVQNVVLNGSVSGDVYANERIELDHCARVNGNVYYHLIEMAIGAEVNGRLVHRNEPIADQQQLQHDEAVAGTLTEEIPGRTDYSANPAG